MSHVIQILGVMALVASSFCEICFIVTGNFELLASLEILNLLATVL
jgi:hypothetical protein